MITTATKLPNLEGYVMATKGAEALLIKIVNKLNAAGIGASLGWTRAFAEHVATVVDEGIYDALPHVMTLDRADLNAALAVLKPLRVSLVELPGVSVLFKTDDPAPKRSVLVTLIGEPEASGDDAENSGT